MNTSYHIDPEDLTLFALQFLTPEQNEQIREHLVGCDVCREELALAQGDLALFALSVEPQAPPAAARDRLMQQIGQERRPQTAARSIEAATSPAALVAEGATASRRGTYEGVNGSSDGSPAGSDFRSPADIDETPKRTGLHLVGRVAPWLGWAAAAGLAFAVQQVSSDRNALRNEVFSVNHQMALVTAQSDEARRLMETLNDPTAQRVTLTLSKQAPVPQGKATYVAAKGALVFVANNLGPLQPQKVYELWLIPSNGQSPIAAGTFHPDAGGNASVIMPRLPQGVTAKAFGITIENEGGAQTPTMPILLAGAAGV